MTTGLRLRTAYSFRSSVGRLDEAMAALLATGEKAYAPITDRASAYGWARWGKAAKEHGLAPVYGLELAVSPDPEAKKPISDYWLFFVKSGGSVEPLSKLLRLGDGGVSLPAAPLVRTSPTGEVSLQGNGS